MKRGDDPGWMGAVMLWALLLAPLAVFVVSFVDPEAGVTGRCRREAGAVSGIPHIVFAAREYYDI